MMARALQSQISNCEARIHWEFQEYTKQPVLESLHGQKSSIQRAASKTGVSFRELISCWAGLKRRKIVRMAIACEWCLLKSKCVLEFCRHFSILHLEAEPTHRILDPALIEDEEKVASGLSRPAYAALPT